MSTANIPTATDIENGLRGRYVIVGQVRPGAQGVVFRATRKLDVNGVACNDDVALKVYMPLTDSERVDREIRALTGVRHQNLPTLVEHNDLVFGSLTYKVVTWEFVEGGALDQRIVHGPLTVKEMCLVGRDISNAVAEVWKKRVVHRDIKPSNILLGASPQRAVLVDLGVARHLQDSSLTTYGKTWGTVGYLSPEQARVERALTCKSDMFALGVVLLESLSGQHPTNRNQNVLLASRPSASQVHPLLPAGLAALVDSMLADRPAYRPIPEAAAREFDHFYSML